MTVDCVTTLMILFVVIKCIWGSSDYIDHYDRSEIEKMAMLVSTKPTLQHYQDTGREDEKKDTGIQGYKDTGRVGEKKESEKRSSTSEQPSAWFLLGLSGNTSLVHRRLPDFMNYLRINVGALAGADYESVRVNSVSYVPSLIVNISFIGNYSLSQLVKLAARNDSVLGLSSVPFYLTSFTSSEDILIPKPLTNSLSTPREEEALLYLGIGAAVAFVLSAGVLVSILILVTKKDRVRDKEPLIRIPSTSFTRYQDPPQIIYSENFSHGIERENECLTFPPLDDNFLPIETEVEILPRYRKDDDSSSWLSDGSSLPLELAQQISNDQNFFAFSDSSPESVQDAKPHKYPSNWNVECSSFNPENKCSHGASLTPNSSKPLKTRKSPPRPPSRTDSLNPYSISKQKACQHERRGSDLVLSVSTSRRDSLLPIPCHTHTSTNMFLAQDQSDKDVDMILRDHE